MGVVITLPITAACSLDGVAEVPWVGTLADDPTGVEVVHPGGEAGVHEGPGGGGERPGAVDDGRDAVEVGRGQGERPVRQPEFAGQARHGRGPAGENRTFAGDVRSE